MVNKLFYRNKGPNPIDPADYNTTTSLENISVHKIISDSEISSDHFKFLIDPVELRALDDIGYSIFELNIIFLTSSGANPEKIINEISLSKF